MTTLRARVVEEPIDDGPRHRIGAAARLVGVSTSVLRLWERQGLVRPLRTRAGYRLYSDADLVQLRRIRRMRDDHVNASGILRLLIGRTRTAAGGHDARAGGRRAGGQFDGGRLRRLRRERGMSLREAAEQAGISTSFLSALERNTADASVATLQRLTRALGITMLDLFDPRRRESRRVRAGERPRLSVGAGVRIEQLAKQAQMLEPQLFVLAPASTSEGAYDHAGEEFVYVLEGEVTFWVGAGERYLLRTGDSLTFPSSLPHRWRNGARGETRLLWINTPPTF